MKMNEFTNPLPLVKATVRAKTASATSNLKTAIYSEGPLQAQQLLKDGYGEDAVVSVSMSEGTQTLTPDQLKLKSLADQKVEVGQRQKEERARQTVAKARGVKMGSPSKINDGSRFAIQLLRWKGIGIKHITKKWSVTPGTVYSVI